VVIDADRLLRQLTQACIAIAVEHRTQTTTLLQVLLQDCSRHSKGPSCSLYAAMKSRVLNVKHGRSLEHALRAHLGNRHVSGGRHRQNN